MDSKTITKTAYLIGGYARAGKSTVIRSLKTRGKKTYSTSCQLGEHAKLLFNVIPHELDLTSLSAKGVSWRRSDLDLCVSKVLEALKTLGFNLPSIDGDFIAFDYHRRLGCKGFYSTREVLIAVAESHRTRLPNMYVDMMLKYVDLLESSIYLETIGGKECDYLVEQLRRKGFNIKGINVRSHYEKAGVDIRKLITLDQCDELIEFGNYADGFDYVEQFVTEITSNNQSLCHY